MYRVFLTAIILSSILMAPSTQRETAQQASAQPIDANAVFEPSVLAMQQTRAECGRLSQPQFGECFVSHMQSAGASPQALAFIHLMDNDGYLRNFEGAGRVAIAFVFYPFRANENDGALLVNGTPPMIDVDDPKFVPQDELAKNSRYAKLLKQHPRLMVFPGERTGTKFIEARKASRDGQQFIVPYDLLDGCHACERVGSAEFAFEFDGDGKFQGVKVETVKSSPGPRGVGITKPR